MYVVNTTLLITTMKKDEPAYNNAANTRLYFETLPSSLSDIFSVVGLRTIPNTKFRVNPNVAEIVEKF